MNKKMQYMLQCKKGSVITIDNGVKTLARVAAQKREYGASILPLPV